MEQPSPSPASSPPLEEFAIGPPAPPIGAATTPQGPALPAALRVFLYLLSWWVLSQILAIPLVGAYIAYAVWQHQLDLQTLLQNPVEVQAKLQQDLPFLVLSTVVTFGAVMIVTPIYTAFLDRRPFRSVGFVLVPRWWAHCLAGFLLDSAHMSVLFGLGLAAGWYHVLGATPAPQSLLIFGIALLVALPAAATEEIMMRGYVLQALEGRYGTWVGIGVNSLLFALMHLANPGALEPMVIFGLLVAGIYFSVAYAATRQLWLPIVGHAVWNVFEGPVYGLPVSGLQMPGTILHVSVAGPALLTGGKFGPEAGIPIIVTTLLWTALVWYVGRTLVSSGRRAADRP